MKKINLLFLITLFITSFGNTNEVTSRDYSEYSQFSLNKIEEDMFTQKEDKYGVYIYQENCGRCDQVKNEIFNFLDNYKETSSYKLYLYEWKKASEFYEGDIKHFKGSISDQDDIVSLLRSTIGKNNTKDIYIYSKTPSLYIIENNLLSDYHYMPNTINNWLSKNKLRD